jgi:hypothetical protein
MGWLDACNDLLGDVKKIYARLSKIIFTSQLAKTFPVTSGHHLRVLETRSEGHNIDIPQGGFKGIQHKAIGSVADSVNILSNNIITNSGRQVISSNLPPANRYAETLV